MGFSLRLEKFCGCCTLRTGSLITGTAGWILTLIQIFTILDTPIRSASEENINTGDSDTDNFLNSINHLNNNHENMYGEIGYGVVSFLLCVLLVIGVYKKDRRFILPWLVLKATEAVLLTIFCGGFFIFMWFMAGNLGVLFLAFLLMSVVTVLVWYFWLCVWSYYGALQEGDATPPVYYSSPVSMPPPRYSDLEEKKQFNMA